MQKVKLPREIAEALDLVRKHGESNRTIVYHCASGKHSRYAIEPAKILIDFAAENFDIFLAALVNGYEIEMTVEERVKERHDIWAEEAFDPNHNVTESMYRIEGMKITLLLLGKTILGVTDHGES